MYYYSFVDNQISTMDDIDTLIMLLYENKGRLLNNAEIKKMKLSDDYLYQIKNKISSYEKRLPLYDVYSDSIFLIYRENIFPRIYYDKYRLITQSFYESLDESNEMFRFLSNYDIVVLENTYLKIFYQSFVMNTYITNCKRPSFKSKLDHIQPYYSSRELYYLAYDLGLLNTEPTFTYSEMENLCEKITAYDIPAKTLIDHQIYIYESKAIGLVKHYSLFGSYFMNKYLRDYYCCFPDSSRPIRNNPSIINRALEVQIKLMIELIRNAPVFCKRKNADFTVYRFIDNDSFLKKIKPGDIYQDPSFMSTTRNPFNYQENYQFGYILMKITLPMNIRGIGLCIESYSNFPTEEEIIFPPTTRLRLDRIVLDQESHMHVLGKTVTKKYEFTLLGNSYQYDETNVPKEIILSIPDGYEPPIPLVNMREMLNNPDITYTSISDRLKFFTKNYVNANFQFTTSIGQRSITFIMESYDSSSIYKDFFYYKTTSGLMIYSFNPKYGNINILIELDVEIQVNYYFKYSVTDSSHQLNLDDEDWIDWLSMLAYVIGSRSIVINPNYYLQYDENDEDLRIMKTRYTYSDNIYQYLKNGKRYFSAFMEIIPGFDYYSLDNLKNYSCDEITVSTDRDELYQIAKKNEIKNIHDFYIFIVENYPKLLPLLESKMDRIFQVEKNPFKNVYYKLDAWSRLYNTGFIKSMPSEKEFNMKKGSFRSLIGDKKIPQFKNRLRTYLEKVN